MRPAGVGRGAIHKSIGKVGLERLVWAGVCFGCAFFCVLHTTLPTYLKVKGRNRFLSWLCFVCLLFPLAVRGAC